MSRIPDSEDDLLGLIGKACRDGQPIKFYRRKLDIRGGFILGYVVDFNSDLVLMQLVDDRWIINGYGIYNTTDITSLYLEFFKKELLVRYFGYLKIGCVNPCIDIGSYASALEAINKKYKIFAVERARVEKGSIYVGRLKNSAKRTFEMYMIDTAAKWDGPESETFFYDDLTGIFFDDCYANVLKTVMRAEGHFDKIPGATESESTQCRPIGPQGRLGRRR